MYENKNKPIPSSSYVFREAIAYNYLSATHYDAFPWPLLSDERLGIVSLLCVISSYDFQLSSVQCSFVYSQKQTFRDLAKKRGLVITDPSSGPPQSGSFLVRDQSMRDDTFAPQSKFSSRRLKSNLWLIQN